MLPIYSVPLFSMGMITARILLENESNPIYYLPLYKKIQPQQPQPQPQPPQQQNNTSMYTKCYLF
eukprot:Pgem_evm2s19660